MLVLNLVLALITIHVLNLVTAVLSFMTTIGGSLTHKTLIRGHVAFDTPGLFWKILATLGGFCNIQWGKSQDSPLFGCFRNA